MYKNIDVAVDARVAAGARAEHRDGSDAEAVERNVVGAQAFQNFFFTVAISFTWAIND